MKSACINLSHKILSYDLKHSTSLSPKRLFYLSPQIFKRSINKFENTAPANETVKSFEIPGKHGTKFSSSTYAPEKNPSFFSLSWLHYHRTRIIPYKINGIITGLAQFPKNHPRSIAWAPLRTGSFRSRWSPFVWKVTRYTSNKFRLIGAHTMPPFVRRIFVL